MRRLPMSPIRRAALASLALASAFSAPAIAQSGVAPVAGLNPDAIDVAIRGPRTELRVATFNASLNRFNAGDLVRDLRQPGNRQAATVAEIIQRVRPDVILINEFDYDGSGEAARLFLQNYLRVGQNGAAPIDYPYAYSAPSNTGIPSGFDLNNNGTVGGADDAFGFGFFPGQFGMVVYSRYPIIEPLVRTFQNFLWKDMPNALLPDDPRTPEAADWYSADELAVFRLSSKSHWDVPIATPGGVLHFLTAHPTPPVFDGPEDRNGTRNHDEIRFFADYIDPVRSSYIYDDAGREGGLAPNALFVIAGDMNADPLDGDSVASAANLLLEHPLIDASSSLRATARSSNRRSKAARTSRTRPTPATTPRTSRTPRRATCAPTTCCRAGASRSSMRRCSGRSRPIRSSRSWACSPSPAPITAWSTSTSRSAHADRFRRLSTRRRPRAGGASRFRGYPGGTGRIDDERTALERALHLERPPTRPRDRLQCILLEARSR
ncbi:MAG: endonuclease/exonuclease/phosphatase family protein [Acidobacteria bacterium]|nr:endonuclease/exonuclease/phosphatase family protein [Acidobacteriota bacterium]